MGKGSSRRPTDTEKFESNYDLIFGKKKPIWEQKREQEQKKQEEEKKDE